MILEKVPYIDIKQITFSGTTDSTGNLKLSDSKQLVLGVLFDSTGRSGYGFLYGDGKTYIRAMNAAGTILANTAISGKAYCIETA